MVVHDFNPSTGWQRQEDLSVFKAILGYIHSKFQASFQASEFQAHQGYTVRPCFKEYKQ